MFVGLSWLAFHSLGHRYQALERFSLGGIGIAYTLVAQGRILMFWYWLTYLLLKKNRARYQQLLPPSEEDQSKQQTE
ncbi:hypothetical protein TRIUR3_01620 [Triticum urartu]|uniref:Uncharacterized protein n=1 Tax=Triticum urartu TaxID=4572 RepID=M7Z0S1_TRIUA|nr:hypothetical protein TRIUR3_01620 [Triticum urartu]